ncbi:hypothetical protein SCHPADRAFT_997319 [Schizopora paradoxa]|uniref:MYND-type domain-containing protein n=1 Tax=Schizopora paradoxa TaxID=27342 RepID=A0A0H2RNB4_9AGAM|nr:hypothetical protein SCHPADRAFT_997319 [Schizopora paradoxa]
MSSSRILHLIKKSRTDMSAFMELTSKLGDIPTKNLLDYVELCHYHLRKPVDGTLSKGVNEGPVWIAASLAGISGITSDMILIEGPLGQRIRKCWPDIVRWAKAITLKNPVPALFGSFCDALGSIFNMILIVSESLLDKSDVYDLAIDLWKGREISGTDCHTELPLLGCLTTPSGQDLETLLRRTGYDGKQIVKKSVDRLKIALASTPIEHQKIIASVSLLGSFVESSLDSVSTAVLLSEAPTVMSSSLARLVKDEADFRLRKNTVMALLRFLNGYIQDGPFNVEELMMHGFLYNCLETASVHPGDDDDDDLSGSCIKEMLPSLAYHDTLWAVADGFGEIFEDGHSVTNLLKKAHANFLSAWGTFQALLLEQILLSCLFERGYERERGACANQSCRKLADRRVFKKCAGCGFTLYCSESCQKQNWSHHRKDCKKVDEDNESEYKESSNQFPRKVATAQINRYWSDILVLAKKNNVPEETLGIRVDYSEYPFKIGVFDSLPFTSSDTNAGYVDEGNDPSRSNRSYYPMVAKEALRRTQDGQRCIMLVVIQFDGRELPSLAYLEDATSLSPSSGVLTIDSHYVDESGNRLYPREDDALAEALKEARTRLKNDVDGFWADQEFYDVADEVLGG